MSKPVRVRLKRDYYCKAGYGPFIVVEESPEYFLGVHERDDHFVSTLISDMLILPKSSYELISAIPDYRWQDVTAECRYDQTVHELLDNMGVVAYISDPSRYRLVQVQVGPHELYFRIERKVSQ